MSVLAPTLYVDDDEASDVLYLRRADTYPVTAREALTDNYLLLSIDAEGVVVGIQLLAAHEMPQEFWLRHPGRSELPPDILAAVDEWMARRR